MVPSFPHMKTRRITAGRIVAALVAITVLVYAGAIVWLIANETRLVFAAVTVLRDRRPAQPYEQIGQAAKDGSRDPNFRAWIPPAPGAAAPGASLRHGHA